MDCIHRCNAHHLPHSLHGVGWDRDVTVTFLRPRSLDLAQDVDAALTWGRVGWGAAKVHPTFRKTLMLPQYFDAVPKIKVQHTHDVDIW